jgi:hypothetical protein
VIEMPDVVPEVGLVIALGMLVNLFSAGLAAQYLA